MTDEWTDFQGLPSIDNIRPNDIVILELEGDDTSFN
jgi:hypothetical protein